MVVLDELAVVDEILAEVEYLLDAVADRQRLRRVVDTPDLAVGQPDRRPVDGVDGDDARGLPRSFGLDLRARREEVVDEMHRRRVDTRGGEAVVACAAITEAKAPGFGRVTEHRPPGDQVAQELRRGVDAGRPGRFGVVVLGVVAVFRVVVPGVVGRLVPADGAVDEIL